MRAIRRCYSTKPVGGLARVAGSTQTPLLGETIYGYWHKVANQHADRPALVCPRQGNLRWSFAEMDAQVNRLAKGLEAAGVKRGDRVGVWIGNTWQHALLQFATARIGAILTSLNPSYKLPELLSALNLVDCSALFVCPTLRTTDNVAEILAALPSLNSAKAHQINDENVPSLKSLFLVDNVGQDKYNDILGRIPAFSGFEDLMHAGDRPTTQHQDIDPSQITNLQFTSQRNDRRTKGCRPHASQVADSSPLAQLIEAGNLINNGFHIGDRMGLTPADILCNAPPLFHCFGLVLGNLAAWTHGSCIVYPNETFDPLATLKATVFEKCTALHGVPTMFLAMLEVIDAVERGEEVPGLKKEDIDFSNLRTGIAAGSSVPASLMAKLVDRLNLKELTIAYGMTESSPVTFQTQRTDPLTKRIETVGTVLDHVEAMVCSPDKPLMPLPVNIPGELYVSGYPLMHSYWHNEKETAKVLLKDETGKTWLSTGDLVSMDEDGFLSVKGRIKDIIIKGGENLFPIVLESHCLRHEGIGDVSIVGVQDDFWGETVGAFVQRANNEKGKSITPHDVRRHIKEFSHQSSPHWVWFLGEHQVLPTFPKTASGKIQKMILRQHAIDLSKHPKRRGFVASEKEKKRNESPA